MISRARKRARRFPWRIERPVFVIAPPRSGSTFLFECLTQFQELTAFTDREGTSLWRRVLPYENRASVSDAVAPEEFGEWRRRQLKTLFYVRSALKDPTVGGPDKILRLIRQPAMRYLDKTVSNAFRLELIKEMFPDAAFVYLIRSPRANLVSMLNGWADPRFRKPALTRYVREAGSALQYWTYAAPPGWRNTLHWTLPAICAWSWQQHAEAILRFRESGDPGRLIHYENLVEDPAGVVCRLADDLDLEVTPEVVQYLAHPPLSRTTLTTPGSATVPPDVVGQIEAVMPLIADTAGRFGY
jgi:hypothetical protein